MTLIGWTQILLFCVLVAASARPLGGYLTRVLDPGWQGLTFERPLYAVAGVEPRDEQSWLGYALALLAFNLAGALLLYGLQRVQGWLPLNPAGLTGMPPLRRLRPSVIEEQADHQLGQRHPRLLG